MNEIGSAAGGSLDGRDEAESPTGAAASTDLAVGAPFRVGVNYWPRRKAMALVEGVRPRRSQPTSSTSCADLGLSLVRIFLLWEDFQPDPTTVSTKALADLETVCDLAADRGLGLDVTFFTGHMSGPNWAPPWLLGDRAGPGRPAGRERRQRGCRQLPQPLRAIPRRWTPRSCSCARWWAGCATTRASGPGTWATSRTSSRARRTRTPDPPGRSACSRSSVSWTIITTAPWASMLRRS